MEKGYRIIAIEACDIYKSEAENGAEVGVILPEKQIVIGGRKRENENYYKKFKGILDYSLDMVELIAVAKKVYRSNKFIFRDSADNQYTLCVINVKFNYASRVIESDGKSLTTYGLRGHFYKNGFIVNGVRYVRYKRSAGSSREGNCLFIDERLYRDMTKRSDCSLERGNGDLASWESYRALSLSAVKGFIKIPIEGILFVPDYKAKFEEDVISVEIDEVTRELIATQKRCVIENDIWDGESLLDESVFSGSGFDDKSMLLLRNKFFKTCAFKTKLKKWLKDKGVDRIEKLKELGGVTLATDVNQIIMVTTPASLKFLKFAGALTEANIARWRENIGDEFGVVKYDKRTKFFGGRMVQSSYQLLNTIPMGREQAEEFIRPGADYISLLREDCDFMRYHFAAAFRREADGEEGQEAVDGLAERSEVIFRLMNLNDKFEKTALYAKFKNAVVQSLKARMLEGRVLLRGTNATLFGNGPELLKRVVGEFDGQPIELKKGQVRCLKFADGEKLVCARSPHITMGNLYCVENRAGGEIWDYFDLGENVVCVNAIGENIQQRLNGCDYDSDSMLITDDKFLYERACKYYADFKVPVCNIRSVGSATKNILALDHKTSVNKIGEIVNLSQRLNSLLWDNLSKGKSLTEESELYGDICKLAVLSGLEIDKAKRSYDNVHTVREIRRIRQKYFAANAPRPEFFKTVDVDFSASDGQKKKSGRLKRDLRGVPDNNYIPFDTPMDYIYAFAKAIDFRDGKDKEAEYIPISSMLSFNLAGINSTDYKHAKIILNICAEYKEKINKRYEELKNSDGNDERAVIYDDIIRLKEERNKKISKHLTNERILYKVLASLEKNKSTDWHYYAPLLSSPVFEKVLVRSGQKPCRIIESEDGEDIIYCFRFTKTL